MPRDEFANFQYIEWQDQYNNVKPFQVFSHQAETSIADSSSTNLVFKEGPTELIHDVRGHEDQFTLDRHGFAFCKHVLPQDCSFENAADIESKYLPEMQRLLKRSIENVDQVYFFDWRVCEHLCHLRGPGSGPETNACGEDTEKCGNTKDANSYRCQ